MSEASTGPVREAAVAGLFYPAEPGELRRSVQGLLDGAEDRGRPGPAGAGATGATPAPAVGPSGDEARPLKAVIAPHAGYQYSGATAGHAYRQLADHRGRVERVVVMGPAHRVPFRGIGLTTARAWSTPFGEATVDHGAMEALDGMPGVAAVDDAHGPEHSIEVHLPFIHQALGDVPIVPLVVGRASTAQVARCLGALWGGDETVIVASSDLSHYLDDATARARDQQTAEAVLEGRPADIGPGDACGCLPVGGLLRAATARGLCSELLHLATSADAGGPTERVVGYGSFVFRPPLPLTEDEGSWLAERAAAALAVGPQDGEPGDGEPEERSRERAEGPDQGAGSAPAGVRRPGASFVTLSRGGELLGCIGTLEPRRPLWQDVVRNTRLAAFRDPRFTPLEPGDVRGVEVKISVLSPLEEVPDATPDRLREDLRPGVDGLVVAGSGRKATFLPDVWATLSEVEPFLDALARKAQWEGNWVEGARAWRYTVQVFSWTVG